ncbi:MAG: hypothetical protein HG457_003785 [Flavobacteriaceae bacterium]|nr:hypothetical protein [Flavobacteriaceae bacterium]
MKNIQTLLLILYIFFRFFAGVSVVLGLVLLLYALISEFWFVVLYIPFVVVLGVFFSKIKLPNIIYKLGVLSLIVGFLGLLDVVFYSIFVEKIEEKILYLFVSIASTGMIIIYPFLQVKRN